MAFAVETEGELILGHSKMPFERRRHPDFCNFAVTPDGRRFICIDDSVAERALEHLVLVQNFSEELKRLVPMRD